MSWNNLNLVFDEAASFSFNRSSKFFRFGNFDYFNNRVRHLYLRKYRYPVQVQVKNETHFITLIIVLISLKSQTV